MERTRGKGSRVRGRSCLLKREQHSGWVPERPSSLQAGNGKVSGIGQARRRGARAQDEAEGRRGYTT